MTDHAPAPEPPPPPPAHPRPPAASTPSVPALPPVPPGADLARLALPARWVGGVFLLTFLLYAAFVPRIVRYASPPTGDQPFYLLDALSLVQDGDLELSNNYANHDEDKFYNLAPHPPDFVGMPAPYPLPRQLATSSARPTEELYSYHPPGLGVLLVPAWIIGSWFGLWWPATVAFMCLIGALIATNIFLLAYETTGRRGVALAVWAALAFSSPLMSYSYLIFSELPTGLATIYALRRLALGWRANGPLRLLLVGVSIGAIPWFALRCAPLAAALALYAGVQWWRSLAPPGAEAAGRPAWRVWAGRVRPTLWLIAPLLGLAALMAAFHLFLYGSVIPVADEREGSGVGFVYWPWLGGHDLYLFLTGAFGLLFSQRFGLLLFTPVYLLAVVGMVAMFRTGRAADRRLLLWIELTALPYLGFIASYSGWTGDWGPPARYASTLVPLLAAPLALGLALLARSWVYRALFGGLALLGAGFMAVMLYDGRTMFSGEGSAILAWLAEDPASPLQIDLRSFVPSFQTPDEMWFPWRVGWLLAAGILIVLLGVFLLGRHGWGAGLRARSLRFTGARLALSGGIIALLLAAWGVLSYDFLRAKTDLAYQASWGIDAPLDSAGGLTYLDGKIYIALFGQYQPEEIAGAVGVFDLATGTYGNLWAHGADGKAQPWAHPGSVTVGPDGLLYVLNNGEGDQALLAVQPDGRIVRQIALDEKTVLGMGLYFDDEGESLYVADQSRGVILQYTSAGGAPLATFTGKEEILNNPRGIAVDAAGNIYTSETFKRVQKLDSRGQLRALYDLNCQPLYFAADPAEDQWLEASCSTGLVSLNTADDFIQFTHYEEGAPRPSGPRGVAYGPGGTLYVLDGQTLLAYKVTH